MTKNIERLSFTISILKDFKQLDEVRKLRAFAYGRHKYKADLTIPDPLDLLSTILIARDKETQKLIGTLRLTHSAAETIPLPQHFPAHPHLKKSFLYVDRLAVDFRKAPLNLTLCLYKSLWLWASEVQPVEVLIAAARRPLIRLYNQVGLKQMTGNLSKGFNIEGLHHGKYWPLMAQVSELKALMEKEHPHLIPFFVDFKHPDLQVFENSPC